jgi:hypothetical protein
VSSGRVSPEGLPLYYCPNHDNPDSGVTVPLYSCAVPHAKKNKRQAKPRAHVGVVWLRGLIVPGEYKEPCVVFLKTQVTPTFPLSNHLCQDPFLS